MCNGYITQPSIKPDTEVLLSVLSCCHKQDSYHSPFSQGSLEAVHNKKWKNHFNEMKGDVGMSGHEK